MARRSPLDGWSRAVGWLKVALPLTALGLLSTLFLVSNRIDPDAALPGAGIDVESRMREPRLTRPVYSALTSDGSTLSVHAVEARPAATAGAPSTASDVTARLTAPDGTHTDLRSDNAVLDAGTNLLHLTGDVNITDAAGYHLMTEALDADLTTTEFVSKAPVKTTGPFGQITADTMTLTRTPKGDGSYLLVFNGRVKLVYHP